VNMFWGNTLPRTLALGSRRVAVIDGLLAQPSALVELAAAHWSAFEDDPGNAFPGPELPLPESASERFAELIEGGLSHELGVGAVQAIHTRLSVVTRQPAALSAIQRVCHRDRLSAPPGSRVLAGVVYLFENQSLGGTGFYEPRVADIDARMNQWAQLDAAQFGAETGLSPSYMTQSNAWFEQQGVVDAAFNRSIWYDGALFHTSHITHPELLQADPLRGRLTLNVFATCSARSG
jgi:hypothetical protein